MSIARFRGVLLIVILIAAAMLIVGFAASKSQNWEFEKEQAGTVDGRIIEIRAAAGEPDESGVYSSAAVSVMYNVDGKPYVATTRQYNKYMRVGGDLTIYYQKNSPSVLLSEPYYLNFLYTVAGILFFIALLIFMLDSAIA